MRGTRGLRPALVDAAGALAALAAAAWLGGMWPSLGPSRTATLPEGPLPAWASRLGLVDLAPGASPNPLVEDRLAMAAGTPAGARLREGLCRGTGIDADRAFRRMRATLVANDGRICPGLIDRLQARAPLAVAVDPPVGWPITLGLVALLLVFAATRLLAAKRGYDRWRLLARSTFGDPRGAGSG